MKITFQSIFNVAWQKFIVERQPPGSSGNGCSYRTPEGNRCAVGWALPESVFHHRDYQASLTFNALVDMIPDLFAAEIVGATSDRLQSFQHSLHDSMVDERHEWHVSFEEMESRYRMVAKKYHLTVPGPIGYNIGSPEEQLSIAMSPCL